MNQKKAKKIRKFMRESMGFTSEEYKAMYKRLKREMKEKGVA